MNRDLIIRTEAEDDLAEAFAWYEERRPGLGVDLLREVGIALDKVRDRPGSFPVVHKHVRRALIKRFPYGVFFVVDDAGITVLAIFHARRNPGVWRRRL